MRCKWHMMYTEWGVTYDLYRLRCEMRYTEWDGSDICCIENDVYVASALYRLSCGWYLMYTEWGVSDIWCRQNEVYVSLTPHSVYIICHTSFCIHHRSPPSVSIFFHLHFLLSPSYVTFTPFLLHHFSPTPPSFSLFFHFHLLLNTSYVTYTSFCIHHMSHLILYTS
jgi:hypothetical protein